jgi:hypothetical protein
VTEHDRGCPHALARDPRRGVEWGAQLRRRVAAPRPADDHTFGTQRQGDAIGSRQNSCHLGSGVQDGSRWLRPFLEALTEDGEEIDRGRLLSCWRRENAHSLVAAL